MPRRARLRIHGIPWHVIQRGNNKSPCFFAEQDYTRYLRYLEHAAATFGCSIHAYVLMTNHVHLLLTPLEADSASQMMKRVGQCYAQYVNRTYRRSGALWEGRFRSCLVQTEDYLMCCHRYIELNPVRAGMVAHPAGYRWSSYRRNAEGEPDAVLTAHDLYLGLGTTDEERRAAYRQLCEAGLDPERVAEIRSATRGNIALGEDSFQMEVARAAGRRAGRGASGRPRGGDRPRFR